VTDTITAMQSATAQYKASTSTTSKEITGDDFLLLMTKQLENQDPMDPTSTSDLLAQEAQFTSLSKTEEMTKSIESNNGVMQALSMVGATVTVKDSTVKSGYSTGVVSSATLNGSDSKIIIGNNAYAVSNVVNVAPTTTTTDSST
nr:hypothetical protein [bacterium]